MRGGMRFRVGPFWAATESKPKQVSPNVALFFFALAVLLAIVAAVWSVAG